MAFSTSGGQSGSAMTLDAEASSISTASGLEGLFRKLTARFEQILLDDSLIGDSFEIAVKLDRILLRLKLWENDLGDAKKVLGRVEENAPDLSERTRHFFSKIDADLSQISDALERRSKNEDEILGRVQTSVSALCSEITIFNAFFHYTTITDPTNLPVRRQTTGLRDGTSNSAGLPTESISQESSAELAKWLGLRDYTESFKKVEDPLPKTCDWIEQKPYYQRWNKTEASSVVFLRGESGTGKSVLSRFISMRQAEDRPTSIVVPFYCHTSIMEMSTKSIMQHILHCVKEQHPANFREAARRFQRLTENIVTFSDLWSMFSTLWETASFTLVAVIDALNEYEASIQNQPKGGQMWDFLDNLCQLCGQNQQGAAILKVFCTSQAGGAVDKIKRKFSETVFDLDYKDLRHEFGFFVEHTLSSRLSNLTREMRETLKQTIVDRAGYKYQWVKLVVEELRRVHSSGRPLEFYQRRIDYLSNDTTPTNLVYRKALENIRSDPKTKPIIAFALRILFFTGTTLSREQLIYAIGCGRYLNDKPSKESLPKALQNRVPFNLLSILEVSCGSLLSIDEDTISFRHDSVREFLGHLSPRQWPEFSCSSTEDGMAMMASICLFFLNSWFTISESDTNDETDKFSIDNSNELLGFVTINWFYYVKSLAHIKKLKPYLKTFLRADSIAYSSMLEQRWLWTEQENLVTAQMSPVCTLLADLDLVNVIREGRLVRHVKHLHFSLWKPNMFKRLEPSIDIDVHIQDHRGNTMLHYAAENGSIDLLKWLIRKGAKGNVFNKEGETPFCRAMAVEKDTCAWELIQHGLAVTEKPSSTRISSLQLAVYRQFQRVVSWLLENGSDIDSDEGLLGWTPLIVAVQFERVPIVRYLLDCRASPGKVTRRGDYALSNAAGKGNTSIMKMLFDADPHLAVVPTTESGWTPLYRAAEGGHVEAFQFLRQKRRKVPPTKSRGWLPVHIAALEGRLDILKLHDPEELEEKTYYGQTPLLLAVAKGHKDAAEYCTNYNDVNCKSADFGAEVHMSQEIRMSWTPLQSAVENGYEDIVKLLLDEKQAKTNDLDARGWTLLHHAAKSGNFSIFKKLLEHGIEPLTASRSGLTPLQVAAELGHLPIVEFLHERWKYMPNYSIDWPSERGQTALHMAIFSGSLAAVQYLLRPGIEADIKAKDGMGRNCLVYASFRQSPEVFDYIMERSSVDEVNHQNHFGSTPLHYAAYSGNNHAVEALLKQKADPNALDLIRESPLLTAVVNFRDEVVQILLNNGAKLRHVDGTGTTLLQRVNEASPLWSKFQIPSVIEERKLVVPRDIRRQLNLSTIRRLFSHKEQPAHATTEVSKTLSTRLGFQVLLLRLWYKHTDDEARILFEGAMAKLVDGRTLMDDGCGNCDETISDGQVYVCRSCFQFMLCKSCFQKRAEGEVVKGCLASHDYLACAGEDWHSLPYGLVNKYGDTMKTFLGKLRDKYCSEPVSLPNEFALVMETDEAESEEKLDEVALRPEIEGTQHKGKGIATNLEE